MGERLSWGFDSGGRNILNGNIMLKMGGKG